MCKLNNTFLNNQWEKEKNHMETRKYHQSKKNKNTT